jgi:DNA-binding MarR family transcriptional regulator
MHIIEKIGQSKEIRMSDLAKAIRVTLGTVTVSINRLVKKGYIERSHIVNDRRVVLIKLTSKGTAVFRLHEIFHKKMVEEIVLGLTPYEEGILAKALGNLANYFKGLELAD